MAPVSTAKYSKMVMQKIIYVILHMASSMNT